MPSNKCNSNIHSMATNAAFGIKNNPVEDSDVAAVKGFKLLCGENAEAAKEYAETYGIVLKTGGTSK